MLAVTLLGELQTDTCHAVHIIHGQEEPRRWKNKIYLSNCVLLGLWLGVFVWLVIPHHTAIRPDGQCRFFVAPGASGAAGGLELFLNTYLSLLFAVPLYKGR